MAKTSWTPVILSGGRDSTVYVVVDDFSRAGSVYPVTSSEPSDRDSIINALIQGRYASPSCVFACSPTEGWSQDASADIAQELRRRCDLQKIDLPPSIQNFVEKYEGQYPNVRWPSS
jgi:hypothetical protein